MRLALGVEYAGQGFAGWQRQPHAVSVQAKLEAALTALALQPVSVVAAGRTDRGVHALQQVVHFDTEASRPLSAWVRAINDRIDTAIAVLWARVVSDDFHARFAAQSRVYRYVLLQRGERPALARGRIGWVREQLDVAAMQAALPLLIGEHDFSAFRAAECQAKSPIRQMQRVEIDICGDCLVFTFEANAFLQHMVRNLVGCLVAIGRHNQKPEWLSTLFAERSRVLAAPTFMADGLYFCGCRYPESFALPPPAELTAMTAVLATSGG